MTAELDKRALEAAARAIIRGRASVGDNLGPPLTGKILERYVDHSWRLWLEDANHAVEAYLAARQDATADGLDSQTRIIRDQLIDSGFVDSLRREPSGRADQVAAELSEVRAILAGTDINSLPNDYPTRRLAEDRMADLARATALPAPPPEGLAACIVREVAELPDRTSPEDWPEAMLVTADELTAIIRQAAQSLRGVPEGWRLVPEVPTKEMYEAFRMGEGHITPFCEGYKAMLAAAPPSPGEP